MTTQNDCKRSRNPMKMVSDLTFQTFRPFLVIWGLFWHVLAIFGQIPPQIQDCRRQVIWPLKMTAREVKLQWRWFHLSLFRRSGHFWSFGTFSAIFGPKLKIVVYWSCDHSKWLQEKQKSNGDGFRWQFQWVHFRPFHVILGPLRAIFGLDGKSGHETP